MFLAQGLREGNVGLKAKHKRGRLDCIMVGGKEQNTGLEPLIWCQYRGILNLAIKLKTLFLEENTMG